MSKTTDTTILFVDPEIMVRQAITRVINSFNGFSVIGESVSSEEALASIDQTQPDMIVLEIALSGPSGIELIHQIRKRDIKIKTVVLSSLDSPDLVAQALLAGADGYILKSSPVEEFLEGLRVAASTNRKFLASKIGLNNDIRENRYMLLDEIDEESSDPLSKISAREREIFHLLASGMPNTAIAKKLFISPRTVETHRARIVSKLGLDSNADLIRFAVKHGLTVP